MISAGRILIVLLAGLAGTSGTAWSAENVEQALKKQYQKQIVVPRTPLQAGDQQFDSSGKPSKAPLAGDWAIYGPVLIHKVSLSGTKLKLEGSRIASSHLGSKMVLT